jgi:hypothetical protein
MPSCLVSISDQDVPINAGGAQLGSTSFTFFVRRLSAALVFGAQLCSARAASEDVIKDAHTKSGSDQGNCAHDEFAICVRRRSLC